MHRMTVFNREGFKGKVQEPKSRKFSVNPIHTGLFGAKLCRVGADLPPPTNNGLEWAGGSKIELEPHFLPKSMPDKGFTLLPNCMGTQKKFHGDPMGT